MGDARASGSKRVAIVRPLARPPGLPFSRLLSHFVLLCLASLAAPPAAVLASTIENPVDPGERTDPAPDPDAEAPPPPRQGPPVGLNFRVRGGSTYQFPTRLDAGGEFTTSRTVLDVGARYGFNRDLSTIVSVAYEFAPYGFSDSVRIGGLVPWTELHSLRISVPIFWHPEANWSVLVVPIVRFQAEEVSDWGSAVSGGAIVSLSYRFSENLRVGPGIGVLSEIEGKPTVFPVLIIDWQVTDRFAFTTGRGLGASAGPGLFAEYEIRKLLTTSLGFRFERTRFRLSPQAGSPGGVGEDESFPVFATLQVGPRYAYAALVTGAEFRGKLRIEDASGGFIAESEYKPSAFIGVVGQIFF